MKKDEKKRYIFRRYITKNGVKIYPKTGKVFKIPVKDQLIHVEMFRTVHFRFQILCWR